MGHSLAEFNPAYPSNSDDALTVAQSSRDKQVTNLKCKKVSCLPYASALCEVQYWTSAKCM